MEKESRQSKSKHSTSKKELKMSSDEKSNGHLIGVEQRFDLQLEQAVELRELFSTQKQIVEAHQENERRIRSALTLLGLMDRDIISADLGDVEPHLIHRSQPNGPIA